MGGGRSARVVAAGLTLAMAMGCADDGTENSDAPARATNAATTTAPTTPLPEPVQELSIDGAEYTFHITPDPSAGLRPGWTRVRLRNVGAEAHQVMFARLKDGVDMAELAAAGAGDSSGAAAIQFVDMIGGVSYIGPGNEITALVNLPEGTVMAMCYVPDAKGVAHALMGMSTMLTVSVDAPPPAPAATPTPDPETVVGTIELAEGGYRFPGRMPRGWYHVTNTDTALHELALLKLSRPLRDGEARTVVDQLARNEVPEVGIDAVGGLGAVSAGFEGYLYLDLDDGDYLAVDFMPDPGNPRPHMLDGYVAELSV